MFERRIVGQLRDALSDTPVVLLTGPRQSGKSTLVRDLLDEATERAYVTLDDAAVLSAARSDPAGFLAGLERPVTIDEIQRAPELLLPIKAMVDRERRPGRFLLTGSADVLSLPKVADSLAGRMEVVGLRPLAQCEIEPRSGAANLVDILFDGATIAKPGHAAWADDRASILDRALAGGFPPAVARTAVSRRRAWFASYLTTILDRDVRDLASIEGLRTLPNLLGLLATRTAGLVNYSELASAIAVSQPTVKRYVVLLERLFLACELRAWSRNLGVRLAKAPKLHVADTGLAAHLSGIDAERIRRNPNLSGPLLETFVVVELLKIASWSERRPAAFHFRTSDGQEVDLVLETASGDIVAVEVKASATVSSGDLDALRSLERLASDSFRRGVILYTGSEVVPFSKTLAAVPMSRLWRDPRKPA